MSGRCPRGSRVVLPRGRWRPSTERLAVERELLHAVVAVLDDVDMPLAVERDAVGIVELPALAAAFAPDA